VIFLSDRILVIGGGEVGDKALRFCQKNDYSVLIVDSDSNCQVSSKVDIAEINHNLDRIKQVQTNKSMLFLINRNLDDLPSILQRFNFKYIIPAIPVHVMAKLSYAYLNQKGIEVRPSAKLIRLIKEEIDSNLIHCYKESEGIIVASFMPLNQECASNCAEFMKCPVTGIEKRKSLHELFKNACSKVGIPAKIFVSEQLEHNLGGIQGDSVKELFNFLDSSNEQITIGTSCICHGIINAIQTLR
jgi:hypothetical protein